MADSRTEYFREYKRKRRQQARTQGRCVICVTGQPRAGNVTCDECQDRANQYKTKAPE